MNIPFFDLKLQYQTIKTEINDAISSVLDEGIFALGEPLEAFENQFARLHNTSYCIGVNSGTSALQLGLTALGLKAGDEVIVPSNTFFATAAAVNYTGATPVFVDCDPTSLNISVEAIKSAITNQTKAIIAVHLYGQAASMTEIKAIAKQHNLYLIEDCAHAHFASFDDQYVGTFGDIGCFSFYPTKNLGAYGEGGAILTQNEAIYTKLLALRNMGAYKRYCHEMIAYNNRLETMQAAILSVKLSHIDEWTKKRQAIATLYKSLLKDCPNIKTPQIQAGATHVYHLYVIQAEQRDLLQTHLKNKGIDTVVHYPIPCHLQPAYAYLNYKPGDLPVIDNLVSKILSLPVYPELSPEQVEYICQAIKDFYKCP